VSIGAPPGALLRAGGKRRAFTEGSTAREERMRPYYHLAMRVLARAVLDVMDPTGSAGDRESARAFLAGSVMLQHWCRVAALDPDYVAESLETFTAGLAMMVPRMPATRTSRQTDVR
jgi:hypothetical protein